MRKLIVSEYVSVDGVMEAPGGEPGYQHTGWTFDFHSPAQEQYKLDEVLAAGALVLGRFTYEGFASAWPGRTDEGGFADKMNSMPKYVVSKTLTQLSWKHSTVLAGQINEEIERLKLQDGNDLLVAGSRTLVHALYKYNLVDEYRLMVFPIILGSGRRLFPDNSELKSTLKLVDSTTFDSGVAVHTYRPAYGI